MNETPVPAVLDQAAFQQVWQRVMPEDRPDCPFTLTPPPVPAPPPPVQPMPRSQTPSPTLPVCLGETSAAELPVLEQLISQTAGAQRIYRMLARRFGRKGLPDQLALAKEQQLRRLNAAHFLICGEKHTAPPTPMPRQQALPLALRERYQAEQQLALALFSAANSANDPCLIDLYRTLGAENQAHADQLRGWMERH